MWSSSRLVRAGAVVAALALSPALAACVGFAPVYSDAGLGSQQVALSYDTPTNRLEQVIYRDLALKLGKSAGVDAPRVHITATASLPTTDTTTSTLTVAQSQTTVVATVNLVDASGKPLFHGTRSVTENFVNGGQAFSNQQAAKDAAERGAKELAETIRLQIIAALLKQ